MPASRSCSTGSAPAGDGSPSRGGRCSRCCSTRSTSTCRSRNWPSWSIDRRPDVHRSTVYRTLEAFEEANLVQHVHLGHSPPPTTSPTSPTITRCATSCGTVIHLPDEHVRTGRPTGSAADHRVRAEPLPLRHPRSLRRRAADRIGSRERGSAGRTDRGTRCRTRSGRCGRRPGSRAAGRRGRRSCRRAGGRSRRSRPRREARPAPSR